MGKLRQRSKLLGEAKAKGSSFLKKLEQKGAKGGTAGMQNA